MYIVTIRMARKNPDHDPAAKKTGPCPFSDRCTDVTGEHHSFLFTGTGDEAGVRETVRVNGLAGGYRLTRLEEVLALPEASPQQVTAVSDAPYPRGLYEVRFPASMKREDLARCLGLVRGVSGDYIAPDKTWHVAVLGARRAAVLGALVQFGAVIRLHQEYP